MHVADNLTKQRSIIEQIPKIINPNRGKISIQQCQILELPKITDHRGNLTVIENKKNIPLKLSEFYLYDVPWCRTSGSCS